MLQRRIIQPAGVKRIASINQRQEIIIAIRAMDERMNERCAYRARRSWLDQFSDSTTRQPAANGLLKTSVSRYSGDFAAAAGRMRKTLRQEVA